MMISKVQRHSLLWLAALILAGLVGLPVRAWAANPVPFIKSISPLATAPAGPGFTLTVSGVGFVSAAVVNWTVAATAIPLATTFVAAGQCAGSECGKPATEGVDPATVEPSSLGFDGAEPLTAYLSDVNGDGWPNLVIVFDRSGIPARSGSLQLTGRHQTGSAFVAKVQAHSLACGGVR